MAIAHTTTRRTAVQPSQEAINAVTALQLGMDLIQAVCEVGPSGVSDVLKRADKNGYLLSATCGLEMAQDSVDGLKTLNMGLQWLAALIEDGVEGLNAHIDAAVMDGTMIEASVNIDLARDFIERQPGF